MSPIRIFIADDHQVVRRGLRDIVDASPDIRVVGEAAHGHEVERLVTGVPVDLLILDISMPGKSGIQILQSLRSRGCSVPILFFSMHPSAQYAGFVRRNGAQGFIDKGADGVELLRAIRQIVGGGEYFPSVLSATSADAGPFACLSKREREVLSGILGGRSLQEIAETLGVGSKSVSTYRRRLLDKLGAESNAELIAMTTRLSGYAFRLSVDADRQT